MSTWGSSSANRTKPKYLIPGSKNSPDKCFATEAGWVIRRVDGNEELLVTIPGLATALAGAQITQVYFDSATYSQTATATVTVVFTEKVTKVSGTPTLSITTSSGLGGSPITFTYASGNGTDKFLFTKDLSTIATIAGETLVLGAQTIGSATFSDTSGGSDTVDTAFVSGDRAGVGGIVTYANPVVTGATILSACFGAGAYAHTATAVIGKVKWNQIVTVTGVPTLSINQTSVGAVTATYTGGTGTDTLTFSVDISAVGVASNSLQVLAQTLGLPGGATIKASTITADLAFVSGERVGPNFVSTYADIVLS